MITNKSNGKHITFDDHTLHQVVHHHYFGYGKDFLDPITTSEVLGLL